MAEYDVYKLDHNAEQIDLAIGNTVPVIRDGYWWRWDVDAMEYVDTGVKAEGKDGKDGKDGEIVPSNAGTAGQVLTRTAGGSAWADASGGLLPRLMVTTDAGASVTAALGSVTVGPAEAGEDGTATLELTDFGDWTVTAAKDGKSGAATVAVDAVKLYEAEVWPANIPSAYTELEYIQSTGTQWIDTGILPTVDNLRVVTTLNAQKYGIVLSDIYYGGYMGAGNSGNGKEFYGSLVAYGPNETTATSVQATSFDGMSEGSGRRNVKNSFPLNTDLEIDYILRNGSAEITVNGTKYTYSYTFAPRSYRYFLFANNGGSDDATPSACRYEETLIYYAGELARDLYPARRDSDGVVGMYDTVSDTFFTNAGTGSFIAGPEA